MWWWSPRTTNGSPRRKVKDMRGRSVLRRHARSAGGSYCRVLRCGRFREGRGRECLPRFTAAHCMGSNIDIKVCLVASLFCPQKTCAYVSIEWGKRIGFLFGDPFHLMVPHKIVSFFLCSYLCFQLWKKIWIARLSFTGELWIFSSFLVSFFQQDFDGNDYYVFSDKLKEEHDQNWGKPEDHDGNRRNQRTRFWLHSDYDWRRTLDQEYLFWCKLIY